MMSPMNPADEKAIGVRLEGLDASLLQELRAEFPQLENVAIPHSVEFAVGEDREASLFDLVVPLARDTVQLLTAVMAYLTARNALASAKSSSSAKDAPSAKKKKKT